MPFQKKMDLRQPEVLAEIFKLRNEQMGFPNIAKTISEKFGVNITHPTAENLYYEYLAKQKIKAEHGEEVDKWEGMLNAKFERIEKITSTLLDAVESIKKNLTPENYLKFAPTIIGILRESLNQLMFIRKEQEQITFNQKNLIYSPLQIMQQINKIEESKKKDKEYVIVPNKEKEPEEEEINEEE